MRQPGALGNLARSGSWPRILRCTCWCGGLGRRVGVPDRARILSLDAPRYIPRPSTFRRRLDTCGMDCAGERAGPSRDLRTGSTRPVGSAHECFIVRCDRPSGSRVLSAHLRCQLRVSSTRTIGLVWCTECFDSTWKPRGRRGVPCFRTPPLSWVLPPFPRGICGCRCRSRSVSRTQASASAGYAVFNALERCARSNRFFIDASLQTMA